MGRLDTAGFFKNLVFYGHSKKQLVNGGDDTGPIDNPTDPYVPCDHCPKGYNCVNNECVPKEQSPLPIINPEPIPIDNPTEETECRTFTSRGTGIKATASGVFSGADANSGGQWAFKCYDSIAFYGRLNASAPSGLVNDIRRGVGNRVRSFVVPAGSIDEQSIFKFEVNVNGEYTISVKRKASGDLYYNWEIYQHGVLDDTDGETLYVGVSAGAEIWSVTTAGAVPQFLAYGDYDLRLPQWQDLDTLYNEGLELRFYSGAIPMDNSYDSGKSYFRIGNFFYYIVQKTQDKSSAESWGEGFGVYFDEPSGYYIVYSLTSYRQVSFDSVLGGYYQEFSYEKHGEVKRPLHIIKKIPANTLNFNHFLVRVEYKTGGTYFTESGLDIDGLTLSYGYPRVHAYYVYTSSSGRKVKIATRDGGTAGTYTVTSDIYGFEIEGNISEGTLTIKRLGQDGSVIGTLNTSSYKDTFLNTVKAMRDEKGMSLRFWIYLTMQPKEMEQYGYGLEHTNKRLKYLFE